MNKKLWSVFWNIWTSKVLLTSTFVFFQVDKIKHAVANSKTKLFMKNISIWSLHTTSFPQLQVIEPWELHALGVGTPHTTHCLADGNVMISTLRWRYPQPLLENIHHRTKSHSDGPAKNGQGNFVLLDGKTFKPKATWPATEKDVAQFGYDFWYELVYSYVPGMTSGIS